MPLAKEGLATPAGGASPNTRRLSNDDTTLIAATGTQRQEAIIGLKREFVAEALRVAAVKASHGADNIELGDDLNAERDIRLAVSNLNEAARSFREIERLKAEGVR